MINFRKIVFFILILVVFINTGKSQSSNNYSQIEIALPSLSGDTIRLSSFEGKVILLDFWASWCGPCRSSNKHLVKLYEKYKDKGFEIFGVSLDENPKAWARAVKKDKIKWVQVNDNGAWYGKTAMAWKVYQIPTSYLIDKDGILIAYNPEIEDLEKVLNEILD